MCSLKSSAKPTSRQIAWWNNTVNIQKNKESVSLMHKPFRTEPQVLHNANYNRQPAGCFRSAQALNAKKSHSAAAVASAPIRAQ